MHCNTIFILTEIPEKYILFIPDFCFLKERKQYTLEIQLTLYTSIQAYEALRWKTKCACRDAGVQYRGEHVFRHTFATNCYYKGMDIKILSRLLGHADVNITYNIYVHLYGDGFDEMYEALVGNRMPTPKNLPLIEESSV